ncbi:MAG: hypothetical protein MZV63_30530 [Marinilabiliales bacterium]|nr:hypothetical protein [Marinilabiliales bacterium]
MRFGEVTGYVKSDGLVAPCNLLLSATPVAQPQAVEQQQYEATAGRQVCCSGGKIRQLTLVNACIRIRYGKGVTSEMAVDSWGKPKQINRMYVDQSVDEEWIYSKKWLYFRTVSSSNGERLNNNRLSKPYIK